MSNFNEWWDGPITYKFPNTGNELKEWCELAYNAEVVHDRERCAKVAENYLNVPIDMPRSMVIVGVANSIADAIREGK